MQQKLKRLALFIRFALLAAFPYANGFAQPFQYLSRNRNFRFLQSDVTPKCTNILLQAIHDEGRYSDEELFLSIQKKNQSTSETSEKLQNTNEEVEVEVEVEQGTDTSTLLPHRSTVPHHGAGLPRDSLGPEEIVPLLMTALQNNDFPEVDAGLTAMWNFATDTTRFVFQNNMTEFIESCHETADEFPTSFYGAALNGQSWNLETEINRVGGEDGWIATHVMKTISSDGRLRRWQWEMRKNRRPPCLGCWMVETIASSDRNGDFQPRDRGNGWSD